MLSIELTVLGLLLDVIRLDVLLLVLESLKDLFLGGQLFLKHLVLLHQTIALESQCFDPAMNVTPSITMRTSRLLLALIVG